MRRRFSVAPAPVGAALAAVASLTLGCEPPSVGPEDAGGITIDFRDAGPTPDAAPWAPPRISPSAVDERRPDLPALFGGTSPPPEPAWFLAESCPSVYSPGFCADCYPWTDNGPDSLGRNAPGDGFGMVARGDLNGDGWLDLAIGAPGDTEGGATGAVYLYLGAPERFLPWKRITRPGLQGFGAFVGVGNVRDELAPGVANLFIGYSAPGQPWGGAIYAQGAWDFEHVIDLDLALLDGPDDVPIGTAASIGARLLLADVDGDGFDDLVMGMPALDGGKGGVWIEFSADVKSEWFTATELGYTASTTDALGASLASTRLAAGVSETLLVGVPGRNRALTLACVGASCDSTTFVPSGMVGPGSGTSLLGLSALAWEDAMIAGTAGSSSAWMKWGGLDQALDFGMRTLRPIALADLDGDGAPELFAAQDDVPGSEVTPIAFIHGLGTTAYPDIRSVDAAPPREAWDQPGAQATSGHFNADGFEDVAIGAPSLGSSTLAGQVFGYYGRAESFGTSDNRFDFDDTFFRLDQETPGCDRCRANEWPEGYECRAGYVCASNACVERTGCGDGYREPGPDPAAELCDDALNGAADACSDACLPQAFVVASGEDESIRPASSDAIAVLPDGRALVVYVVDGATTTEVRAKRYDARGRQLGSELLFASMPGPGRDPAPSVVTRLAGLVPSGGGGGGGGGTPTGWAVTWAQTDEAEVGSIAMTVVSLEGAVTPAVRVDAPATAAEIFTYGIEPQVVDVQDDTFLVAWTDATDPAETRVLGRWVTIPPGTTRLKTSGVAFELGDGPGGDVSLSQVAGAVPAGGHVLAFYSPRVLVAWTEAAVELGDRPRVVLRTLQRQLDGTTTLSSIVEVAESASDADLSSGEDIAIAWIDYTDDPQGDVNARTVSVALDGTPLLGGVVELTAAAPATTRRRPAVTGTPNGLVVGWEEPANRAVRIAGDGVPANLSLLTPELEGLVNRDVALAWSSKNLWVLWSDARRVDDTVRVRSTMGFLFTLPESL